MHYRLVVLNISGLILSPGMCGDYTGMLTTTTLTTSMATGQYQLAIITTHAPAICAKALSCTCHILLSAAGSSPSCGSVLGTQWSTPTSMSTPRSAILNSSSRGLIGWSLGTENNNIGQHRLHLSKLRIFMELP